MISIIASPGAPSPHRPKCAGSVGAFFRHIFTIGTSAASEEDENMENQLGPEKTLEMLEQDLATFERLSEKEFNAELVKSELEKLSKEELVELQMNMFVQYHQMAKIIVELTEALRKTLR
jgi:hypothetical protein